VISWIVILLQYNDAAAFYGALAIVFFLLLIKQMCSVNIAFSLGYHERGVGLWYQYGLILFRPLIDIFILLALCRSMHSSVVSWSHITYRVAAPNIIKVQARATVNRYTNSK
jgi:hypothetical protein